MSLLRLTIKNSFLYSIPTILTRGINFFSALLYTFFLTPAEYGSLEIYILCVSILAIVATLDISSGVGRIYSESSEKEKKIIFNTAFYTVLFLCSISILIIFNINDYFFKQIFKEIDNFLVFMVILNMFVYSIYYFLKMQFRWNFQEKEFIFVTASTSILMLILAACGLIFYEQSLEVVIFANLFAYFYGLLISIYFLRNLFAFEFSIKYLKELISFSTPLIPAALIGVSLMFVDRIMIDYYMGIDAVGVYSLGVRFAGIALICYVGVDLAISPILYSSYKNSEARLMLAQVFRVFVFVSPIAASIILLFTDSYFLFFEKQEYIEIKDFILILIFATLLAQLHLFFPGLWIAKKTYIFLFLSLSAVIINIILNYFWINLYGLYGAALSSLFSYVFLAVSSGIFSQMHYPVKHNFKKLFLYLISSLICFYYLFYFIEIVAPYMIIFRFLILLIFLLFLGFMFNIVNIKDFKKLKITIKNKLDVSTNK